jgi:hypothetical protein
MSLCLLAWQVQGTPRGKRASAASANDTPFPPLRPLNLPVFADCGTPAFAAEPLFTGKSPPYSVSMNADDVV